VAGLLLVGFVLNWFMHPVHEKYHMSPEDVDA